MDVVAAIPDYDLPYRAAPYDLVFKYDVRQGDSAADLAHRGRGALHVEVSPAVYANATSNTTNGTRGTPLERWLVSARVAADAGAFGAIRRASNGALVTRADTSLRGAYDLEAVLGFGGGVHVDRQWRSGDRFAARVEVVVRGLAHPHAADLEVNLTRGNVTARLFGPGAAQRRGKDTDLALQLEALERVERTKKGSRDLGDLAQRGSDV